MDKDKDNSRLSKIGLPASAVVTGSFLSGTMLSISLISVPVFLDTNTQVSLLARQWSRTFHYGTRIAPAMAVATLSLYSYSAFKRRREEDPRWGRFALAGLTTVLIVPFTALVMRNTNNALFKLEAESAGKAVVGGGAAGAVAAGASLEEARKIVTKWSRMNVARALIPLAGAVLGLTGIFE